MASSGDLPADVVVDLTTRVRPGAAGYPLTAARETLQSNARWTFRELVKVVERENVSVGREKDDEVFDPEEGDDGAAGVEDTLRALAGDAFTDPDVARILAEVTEGGARLGPVQDRARGSREGGVATGGDPSISPTEDGSKDGGDRAREEGDRDRAREEGDRAQARTGRAPVDSATSLPSATIQVAPSRLSRRTGNPFGAHAGLRISKAFDKSRARSFKRNPRRWLPFLALWEATLRLTAQAGLVARPFKPGFILQDGTVGMVSRRPEARMAVIYINPVKVDEVLKANRSRPLAIAAFLQGVAVHELSHLDGRMGQGHDENFICAREDLGARTAYILPVLGALATRLLRLPVDDELSQLRARLEAAERARATISASHREVTKGLEQALRTCLGRLTARGGAVSAKTRAACSSACGCEDVGASGERYAGNSMEADRETAGSSGAGHVVTGSGEDGRVAPGSGKGGGAATDPSSVLEAISTALLSAPPSDVPLSYIAGFLARNRKALLATVERHLGVP